MLKRFGAIAFEIREELVVREYLLITAFRDYGQIIQVFKEPFVLADWKNHGHPYAVLVCKVAFCRAHGFQIKHFPLGVEITDPGQAPLRPRSALPKAEAGNGI